MYRPHWAGAQLVDGADRMAGTPQADGTASALAAPATGKPVWGRGEVRKGQEPGGGGAGWYCKGVGPGGGFHFQILSPVVTQAAQRGAAQFTANNELRSPIAGSKAFPKEKALLPRSLQWLLGSQRMQQ